MKYTKEQLDRMDDVQITLAVAKKLGLVGRIVRLEKLERPSKEWRIVEYVEITCTDNQTRTVFKPCESWDDVMPIAEKYEMKLDINDIYSEVMVTEPCCDTYSVLAESHNSNPRRAICEVFLMMDLKC
jgi:hypothetical protein